MTSATDPEEQGEKGSIASLKVGKRTKVIAFSPSLYLPADSGFEALSLSSIGLVTITVKAANREQPTVAGPSDELAGSPTPDAAAVKVELGLEPEEFGCIEGQGLDPS